MRLREFKMRDGLCAAVMLVAMAIPAGAQTVKIDATPAHAANTFSPLYALGSTVDRVPAT